MVHLPYTLESFSQEHWEHVFGAFVKANNSHWRGAPYDAVLNMLKTHGRFQFEVKAMGVWTCRFLLTVLPDGHLDATFVPNTELSGLMRGKLERMQDVFEKELSR
jgi:hypothetical protein